MSGIIDMHCHVLPGVDDGPATMADSIEILREAHRQGVEAMVLTPHFHPGRYLVQASKVMESLEAVRAELRNEGIPIRLYAGQECYYYSDLIQQLNQGNVLTMAGSEFVLIEFDPDTLYTRIEHAVQNLIGAGYHPIIAHYERYACLHGREDRLEALHHRGAKLQLNFDRLLARDSLFRKNPWRQHVKDDLVDFLGSDTHGMQFRPIHADRAVAWVEKNVARDIARRVCRENLRMLNVEID